MPEIETETRTAFRELLDTLREADERWLSEEWGMTDPGSISDGHRALVHILEGAIACHFESDPLHPDFRRIVTPTRKMTGDNADAVYFEAPIDPTFVYRITGNIAGAIYTSITVEAGAEEGKYSTRTAGVINDTQFDIAPDGSYEITLGGPAQDRNWLALDPAAARLTTRHYYETPEPAACDPSLVIPLAIEIVGDPPPPPPTWDDTRVAAGIRRIVNYVRGKTVEAPKPGEVRPDWVSTTPNVFTKPEVPGDLAFAAFDAAYAMAPYVLAPDEALVITSRWPKCRFANVSLWNRFLQTYDYVNRPVARNRSNTTLEPDGSWRMILAPEDPGVGNWIDTEGRPFGIVYWRWFLPEEEVPTPETEVVKLADLKS
ncbi:MAG TPA: DUF1214 domain-containing protein [Acidimicrobiia bacterium]|nr:DUF1214 domain-containing protein [Acidimicrobiia bacterium]